MDQGTMQDHRCLRYCPDAEAAGSPYGNYHVLLTYHTKTPIPEHACSQTKNCQSLQKCQKSHFHSLNFTAISLTFIPLIELQLTPSSQYLYLYS